MVQSLQQYTERSSKSPVILSFSRDGIHWEKHATVGPSVFAGQQSKAGHPVLFFDPQGHFVLGWRRAERLAFSRSADGAVWSQPKAEINFVFHESWPSSDFSFIQDDHGKYRLAFLDYGPYPDHEGRKLWVAESQDPF